MACPPKPRRRRITRHWSFLNRHSIRTTHNSTRLIWFLYLAQYTLVDLTISDRYLPSALVLSEIGDTLYEKRSES
ncbi:MAG: hypothetical protein OEY21_07670, partial [Nitrospira sp.]|nr:hypothetical protein [Nitrospira sp.]